MVFWKTRSQINLEEQDRRIKELERENKRLKQIIAYDNNQQKQIRDYDKYRLKQSIDRVIDEFEKYKESIR